MWKLLWKEKKVKFMALLLGSIKEISLMSEYVYGKRTFVLTYQPYERLVRYRKSFVKRIALLTGWVIILNTWWKSLQWQLLSHFVFVNLEVFCTLRLFWWWWWSDRQSVNSLKIFFFEKVSNQNFVSRLNVSFTLLDILFTCGTFLQHILYTTKAEYQRVIALK